MFSFLLRPKWVIFTLLVPVGVVLCLLAADWQYGRHVDRSAMNTQVDASAAIAAVPVSDLVSPNEPFPADAEFRAISTVGTFVGPEVLVRKQVLDSAPGYWVVNTLRTDTGPVLQVLRGWIPLGDSARTSPTVPSPPTGQVTVVGWLAPTQTMPNPAPADLPERQVVALDTAVLAAGEPTYPGYLVATAMQPADAAGLKPVPIPRPGFGPHLAYSWQWIFFALLLPVGWVLMVRREIRESAAERAQSPTAVHHTSAA